MKQVFPGPHIAIVSGNVQFTPVGNNYLRKKYRFFQKNRLKSAIFSDNLGVNFQNFEFKVKKSLFLLLLDPGNLNLL